MHTDNGMVCKYLASFMLLRKQRSCMWFLSAFQVT
jgi:hypothetical protein